MQPPPCSTAPWGLLVVAGLTKCILISFQYDPKDFRLFVAEAEAINFDNNVLHQQSIPNMFGSARLAMTRLLVFEQSSGCHWLVGDHFPVCSRLGMG